MYRFTVAKPVKLMMVPKRCWLERTLQRKASVNWYNRSWEGPWTRLSRCPTGRNVLCASAKLDMQVSYCARTDTQWQGDRWSLFFSLLNITDYFVIPDEMQTNKFTPYSSFFLSFLNTLLAADAYCLLDVYSVLSKNPEHFGLPADLWSISSSQSEKSVKKKKGKQSQAEQTGEVLQREVNSHLSTSSQEVIGSEIVHAVNSIWWKEDFNATSFNITFCAKTCNDC